MNKLENKKVATLVANGFERVELTSSKEALEQELTLAHINFTRIW
jgi:hypothetical protein